MTALQFENSRPEPAERRLCVQVRWQHDAEGETVDSFVLAVPMTHSVAETCGAIAKLYEERHQASVQCTGLYVLASSGSLYAVMPNYPVSRNLKEDEEVVAKLVPAVEDGQGSHGRGATASTVHEQANTVHPQNGMEEEGKVLQMNGDIQHIKSRTKPPQPPAPTTQKRKADEVGNKVATRGFSAFNTVMRAASKQEQAGTLGVAQANVPVVVAKPRRPPKDGADCKIEDDAALVLLELQAGKNSAKSGDQGGGNSLGRKRPREVDSKLPTHKKAPTNRDASVKNRSMDALAGNDPAAACSEPLMNLGCGGKDGQPNGKAGVGRQQQSAIDHSAGAVSLPVSPGSTHPKHEEEESVGLQQDNSDVTRRENDTYSGDVDDIDKPARKSNNIPKKFNVPVIPSVQPHTDIFQKRDSDCVPDVSGNRWWSPTLDLLAMRLDLPMHRCQYMTSQLVIDALVADNVEVGNSLRYSNLSRPAWWPEGVEFSSSWSKFLKYARPVYEAAYARLKEVMQHAKAHD